MQPFRNFGESDDPWFRVGQLAVTTTIIVSAMSVAYMFVWAFEGFDQPITKKLVLISGSRIGSVGEGEIWRLVTWPLPTDPDLWSLLLIAVFWMLGSQLEVLMGRLRFTFFLLLLTVVPALIMTALEFADVYGVAYGLRYVELGVLVAFATHYSSIRFWPGIPAWGLAGIIVGMAMLQAISARGEYDLILTVTMAFLSPLLLRALGHAEQHEWIPKFPLPAKLGDDPYRRPPTRQRRRPQPRQHSTHLTSVPPPPPPPAPADIAAQARIDALLDKMGEHGMESLTEAERRSLEDLSKRLRDKRDQG
ncbi:MAG: hypothetical protein F4Z58_15305 [Acidimicrobiaceae bacterium]|nr:hypothetical protein [Acidimicrobiaceae bacterium]MYD06457.1 hypothetical protein [Acidimicrobiaceae bacterium]MYI57879.1 hypothetical protein [Acidimicrobiaceae bacterium]